MHSSLTPTAIALCIAISLSASASADEASEGADFYEKHVRPIFVEHCYECHSEQAGEQQGGLLLDRQSGWLEGGETNKAVIPGEPEASLLLTAVRYEDADFQMPPDEPLPPRKVDLLRQWIQLGAPGPRDDMGETEFSQLGDQDYLFEKAARHWAFLKVDPVEPPHVANPKWNQHAIDRFIYSGLASQQLSPSGSANPRTLYRRLKYALVGLPPTVDELEQFEQVAAVDSEQAIQHAVDSLLGDPSYGQHFARLWMDVARYADTDSAYRPDTKTPHYFPFAFTYRDYVVDSFNSDKPYDQFIREQFAADLLGFGSGDPEIAALGFLGVGPHANRAQAEALDEWIDLTTRGLMGLTVACARCHDHKYEPVPTSDYYALRGVFASVKRIGTLDEKRQPLVSGYTPSSDDVADFEQKREAIEKKISDAGSTKAKNNNRSIAQKIRETELAELLLFHPGGPAHAMVVTENPRPSASYVFIRGDARSRGEAVDRRFVSILDSDRTPFSDSSSGRLELADRIVAADNPLTARVIVNRVWGQLMGSHLVGTPSDFGLQGAAPTHPELLDWLADDFVTHGWSIKRLVKQIVLSQTFAQRSRHRDDMAAIDPENRFLWRFNRRHLSIEEIRDSLLAVSGTLDETPRGRPGQLWGDQYTHRRSIYGYINRFNLDPTLRAFDFPAPMQTNPGRGESIVASQALFVMNSPFVTDQADAVVKRTSFQSQDTDEDRIRFLFRTILQREPVENELTRVKKFITSQRRIKTPAGRESRFVDSPWPLIAQSIMMSNEFQYVD